MNKRAGKRKHRQGVQPQQPRNGQPVARPHTLVEDGLDPATSLHLETAAIARGWIVADDSFADVRLALMRKLAGLAAKSVDVDTVTKVVRTLSIIEQRAESLEIHRARLRQPKGDLPAQIAAQINIQNNVGTQPREDDEPDIPRLAVNEVVDEILSRQSVRDAIDADVPRIEGDYGM